MNMTRQSATLEYLVALAAQFPATLLRIMERDSEHVELTGGIAASTQTREVQLAMLRAERDELLAALRAIAESAPALPLKAKSATALRAVARAAIAKAVQS
jgi:hypothetical protein